MAKIVTMPKFGAIMENGKIIKWVKNIGEQINKNDILNIGINTVSYTHLTLPTNIEE